MAGAPSPFISSMVLFPIFLNNSLRLLAKGARCRELCRKYGGRCTSNRYYMSDYVRNVQLNYGFRRAFSTVLKNGA